MIRISEIQQLPEFLETFPGNFSTICPLFPDFRKFRLNGKRPLSPSVVWDLVGSISAVSRVRSLILPEEVFRFLISGR